MLAPVLRRDFQPLAIPAYAGCRILPAHTFVAVGMACRGLIREVGHPIVGQAYILPAAVVKLVGIWAGIVD